MKKNPGRSQRRSDERKAGVNPRSEKRRFYHTANIKPLSKELREKHILDQF